MQLPFEENLDTHPTISHKDLMIFVLKQGVEAK